MVSFTVGGLTSIQCQYSVNTRPDRRLVAHRVAAKDHLSSTAEGAAADPRPDAQCESGSEDPPDG